MQYGHALAIHTQRRKKPLRLHPDQCGTGATLLQMHCSSIPISQFQYDDLATGSASDASGYRHKTLLSGWRTTQATEYDEPRLGEDNYETTEQSNYSFLPMFYQHKLEILHTLLPLLWHSALMQQQSQKADVTYYFTSANGRVQSRGAHREPSTDPDSRPTCGQISILSLLL